MSYSLHLGYEKKNLFKLRKIYSNEAYLYAYGENAKVL